MPVAVVQVGIVRMLVRERGVPMPMAVRLPSGVIRRVLMLVMGVVDVPVLVFHRLVNVLMCVRLSEVQIDADGHQRCRRE